MIPQEIQTIQQGWLLDIEKHQTEHFSLRPKNTAVSLLVIHNISLPPGKFGGSHITDFFLGRLQVDADPYFEEIAELRVSAHCLIQRDGNIVQYVSFDDMAWHAGVSTYKEKERCNDFSIGIELEGTDELPYTDAQYQQLAVLTKSLIRYYPNIEHNIAGHCDIAPIRKTDPGESFDWALYKRLLAAT